MHGTSDMQNPYICKLFILLYFIVFALMPLSGIHVEYQPQQCLVLTDEPNPPIGNFAILHELLFSHLNNRSDQAQFTSISSITDKRPPNASNSDIGPTYSRLKSNDYMEMALIFPWYSLAYSVMHGQGQKAFGGYNSFFSGLSPPSVFIS
jgi:hypothetical protein